ncbi:Thioredoxin [Corchorus olitorius]|uniref:Thioredoxin n=1 Tax=Corchorus olitorius TaxID=93759 RepID=A0A1R3KC15_9ROSI|nr:Thioredoxin [Corchorus olitorius]
MAAASVTLTPITAAASSSLASDRRISVKLPEFRGLKSKPRSVSLTQSSRSLSRDPRRIGRGGRIFCEAQETAVDAVPSVNDEQWQSVVLDSEVPVLVEFWAPWCGPCRMILPIIEELSREYAGKLKCYKLNTDESPNVATRYGIRSIPTVMIFKGGEKKDAVIGAVPRSTLTSCIEKFL